MRNYPNEFWKYFNGSTLRFFKVSVENLFLKCVDENFNTLVAWILKQYIFSKTNYPEEF